VDFLDYFRGRRPWAQLTRLLQRLPRHSAYRAALDGDEDYAKVVAALVPADVPAEVPLVGYSEIALRLDNLFDVMNAVNETLIAIHSSSRPRPNRAPRPRTALQRLKETESRQRLLQMEHQLTGGR
jgi:hypothetical protein